MDLRRILNEPPPKRRRLVEDHSEANALPANTERLTLSPSGKPTAGSCYPSTTSVWIDPHGLQQQNSEMWVSNTCNGTTFSEQALVIQNRMETLGTGWPDPVATFSVFHNHHVRAIEPYGQDGQHYAASEGPTFLNLDQGTARTQVAENWMEDTDVESGEQIASNPRPDIENFHQGAGSTVCFGRVSF